MLTRLSERLVRKPWGRPDGPQAGVAHGTCNRLGEIWYSMPANGEGGEALLIKRIFTTERLSIQVHPDDEAARTAGHPQGKDEAWVILECEPDSEIGLGLKSGLALECIESAALDGSIEEHVHWRPVAAGDSFYVPAGTIHSIGAGLTLLEVQQNVDLTYRLYDFGRGRALHLAQALGAIKPENRIDRFPRRPGQSGRMVLVEGPKFAVERLACDCTSRLPASASQPFWLIPLHGRAAALDVALVAPGVFLLDEPADVHVPAGAEILCAYEKA